MYSSASLAARLQASTESPGRCQPGQSWGSAANARAALRTGTTLAGTVVANTRFRAFALAGSTVGRSAGSPAGRPNAAAASAGASVPQKATCPSDGIRPPGQKVACSLPGSVSVGIKPLVGFSVSGDGGRQGRTEERLADVINE